MKYTEIASKSDAELVELLHNRRIELATATVESRTKEIKDVKRQGRVKQTIAQVLTLMREREIAKEEQA